MSKHLDDLVRIAMEVKALPKPDQALIINPASWDELTSTVAKATYNVTAPDAYPGFMGLRVFTHVTLPREQVLTFKSTEDALEAIEILDDLQRKGWANFFSEIMKRYTKGTP